MKIAMLIGALVAFLLLVCGMFLFGPCGPSSPIVYVLMFPGLLLAEWVGDLGVLVIQLAFGATVGAIVSHLLSSMTRPPRNPGYSKCDICGTEMFAKYTENGVCIEYRKRMGLGQSR